MKKSNIIIIIIVLVVAAAAGYFIGKGSNGGVPVNGAGLKGAGSGGVSPAVLQGSEDLEMINSLKAKIEKNPNDAESLAFLGDIYFELRQFRDAIGYYKRAIKANPKDVDSYNDLGLANHYGGDSKEGLRVVEEGIKVDPLFPRIWLTKGFILAATGNITDAREAWRKVIAIDPDSGVGKAASSFLAEYKDESAEQAR
ncbi:MAG: tetratricopeptide repeat protein [Thermodesulfobacteriota bacterium]